MGKSWDEIQPHQCNRSLSTQSAFYHGIITTLPQEWQSRDNNCRTETFPATGRAGCVSWQSPTADPEALSEENPKTKSSRFLRIKRINAQTEAILACIACCGGCPCWGKTQDLLRPEPITRFGLKSVSCRNETIFIHPIPNQLNAHWFTLEPEAAKVCWILGDLPLGLRGAFLEPRSFWGTASYSRKRLTALGCFDLSSTLVDRSPGYGARRQSQVGPRRGQQRMIPESENELVQVSSRLVTLAESWP